MQRSTGKIMDYENAKQLAKEKGVPFEEEFMEVNPNDMTKNQKRTKQVSKHDNKSVLGSAFLASRKKIRKRNPKVPTLQK